MCAKPTAMHQPSDGAATSAGVEPEGGGGSDPDQQARDDGSSSGGEDEAALHTDDVFHILQNERRRRVIEYLRTHENGRDPGVDMRDVVEEIAAEEHDTSVAGLSSTERQRVYIALYQSHLPKLDDHGIIEYDQNRGQVRLTGRAKQVIPFLDIVNDDGPDGDRVQFAAPTILVLGTLLVAGALLDVPPLAGTTFEASAALLLLTFVSVLALLGRA